MKYLHLFVLLFVAFVCNGQQKLNADQIDLDSIFRGHKGTFVLYDYQRNNYKVYNQERAKTAFAVHSTSKIFWSIIGLEEGIVANGTDVVKWDSIKYPCQEHCPEGWNKDQTIVTALHYSVNWYYTKLLALMTPEMVEKYLNNLDYQKGFKVDTFNYFTLTLNIKKSAYDQIDFLKRLYTNEFKLSDKTLKIVKQGLLRNKTTNYTLYAKTGLGPIGNNETGIGWYIGFIEKGNSLYFFALNIENDDESIAAKLRIEFSMRALKALGII
jgi:bla regulator protein blaR1